MENILNELEKMGFVNYKTQRLRNYASDCNILPCSKEHFMNSIEDYQGSNSGRTIGILTDAEDKYMLLLSLHEFSYMYWSLNKEAEDTEIATKIANTKSLYEPYKENVLRFLGT